MGGRARAGRPQVELGRTTAPSETEGSPVLVRRERGEMKLVSE